MKQYSTAVLCLAIVGLNMVIWALAVSFLLKVFSFTFSTAILITLGLYWKSQVDGEKQYGRK